jgi:hypothetical protein
VAFLIMFVYNPPGQVGVNVRTARTEIRSENPLHCGARVDSSLRSE